jgi:hypothetical protein
MFPGEVITMNFRILLSTLFFISTATQVHAFSFTSKEASLNANSEATQQKEAAVDQFDATLPFTKRLVLLCGKGFGKNIYGIYQITKIYSTHEEDENGNIVIKTKLEGMADEMLEKSQTLDLEKETVRIAILRAIANGKHKEKTFFKLDNQTKCSFNLLSSINRIYAECITVITPELFSKLMKELD